MYVCVCVCLYACDSISALHCSESVFIFCSAGEMHMSTQLETVPSGYGAATRENREVEFRSRKLEGEGLSGTTRGKVSMH